MPRGNIILLNGASSAGKTTLLRVLQQTLPEPYLEAGIDKFLWMLPGRFLDRPLWYRVIATHHPPDGEMYFTSGEIGDRLIAGMHRAIAALAEAGNHVLVDHVFIAPHWLADCVTQLADFEPLFVGVRCPLEVLEQRERERRDRTLGQARAHHALVHAHAVYDLEVDSSTATPEGCAAQIRAWLASGARPSAFARLRAVARRGL